MPKVPKKQRQKSMLRCLGATASLTSLRKTSTRLSSQATDERQSTVSWDVTWPLAYLTHTRMRLRFSAAKAMKPSASVCGERQPFAPPYLADVAALTSDGLDSSAPDASLATFSLTCTRTTGPVLVVVLSSLRIGAIMVDEDDQ